MSRRAFTLIELLVVISIIGLLSGVAAVSVSSAGAKARNQKRKADLVQISKALELYYADNGGYPSTATQYWSVSSVWGSKADSGSNGWIPNLAPAYMAVLPRDPKTNIANPSSANSSCVNNALLSAYIYISDGIDYKVISHCAPEGTLSASDPLSDPQRTAYSFAVYTSGARTW